jgi:hypothetical protein
MDDNQALLIIAIILAFLSMIGQFLEVLLNWYMLRELGDIDEDRKDWWEKMPWRKP